MFGRVMRHLAMVVAGLGCAPVLPGAAWGHLMGGSSGTFPAVVTVGQTGVPVSMRLFNQNTPPEDGMLNTVCNFEDPYPACPQIAANEFGINVTPSCNTLGLGGFCAGAIGLQSPGSPFGADPGVVQLSPTATGVAGSACAGMVFNVTLYDSVFGRWQFTPQPAGTTVLLPGAGSACVIAFTFDVLKTPSVDSDPGTPGLQTIQILENTQYTMIVGSGEFADRQFGNSVMTVQRAAPAIASTASPNVKLGGQITDTAIVSGRVAPQAGATVSFQLFGPGDATCSGTPAFESLNVPYPIAGGPVASASFTPTAAGTYQWVASYSGDANNAPISGACDDAEERVVVPLSTAAPAMSDGMLLGALGILIAIAALAMARRGNQSS